MTNKILMIGTFPPPVHGMANANLAIMERLEKEGWAVTKFNTATGSLNRTARSHLNRFLKMLSVWYSLVRFYLNKENSEVTTYIALSGGLGQVYDVITVILCRIMGARMVMHHHSFAYLDTYRNLTSLLFTIAGKRAHHIVLCNKMLEKLKTCYQIEEVTVLSNIALFPIKGRSKYRHKLRTIGFLSNITHEKGGEIVIELAQTVKAHKMPLRIIIAGPCHDKRLVAELTKADDEMLLQWRGAVYGKEKLNFWNEVDVLIFPTQYSNEAEPLVIWEALAAGIPAIVYSRGCIAEQISVAGIAVPINEDFVGTALPILNTWIQDPESFKEALDSAKEYYGKITGQQLAAWEAFKQILANE